MPKISKDIFRAYDIRGIVNKDLTIETVHLISKAFAVACHDKGIKQIVVARDGRLSGKMLQESFQKGLLASGIDVIDIGMVPTPVLYFACFYFKTNSGIMITGSHNPPNHNGLKMVLAGKTLFGKLILNLYHIIRKNKFIKGVGSYQLYDLKQTYIKKISTGIHLKKPMNIAIDCGNGVTSEIAYDLFATLGCSVEQLYCTTDGNFPNHHPDPSKLNNLTDLIKIVKEKKLDLGLAFDGDGDRLGVVDSDGNIIWPDRQMILYARDILSSQKKAKIIYDVKCSTLLQQEIIKAGGIAIMSKTGHSFIKRKMLAEGALLGGEMSGHIFFKHRWFGFDDALYSASRLLEILSKEDKNSALIFGKLPDNYNTPEICIDFKNEGDNFDFITKFKKIFSPDNATITTIDGLRADFVDGWGLVRASNTTPAIVLRFEGSSKESLQRIISLFKKTMFMIDNSLVLDF
jgi:phosphomannomutase / phosphoglucomutase